jgi:hypothetical protein
LKSTNFPLETEILSSSCPRGKKKRKVKGSIMINAVSMKLRILKIRVGRRGENRRQDFKDQNSMQCEGECLGFAVNT